ncbi:hypothetical protein [Brevibacterium sp. XM4083]|uniref:hypothetical protein n=1 Tax=Brevibacterium sp. XM4083 TaxID=2583238 RepID=UPI00112D1BF2|nr:hypothetical protein [Brevibacterium sp. XM4083]MCM1011891.1 hypothetical protein [Brevibacterium sp. XM4083]
MDFSHHDDQALEALRSEVVAEQNRRWTLAQAGATLDSLTRSVLTANGVTEGDEWVRPADATTSYPKGWRVTLDGKTWTSTRSGNTLKPGGAGWTEEKP